MVADVGGPKQRTKNRGETIGRVGLPIAARVNGIIDVSRELKEAMNARSVEVGWINLNLYVLTAKVVGDEDIGEACGRHITGISQQTNSGVRKELEGICPRYEICCHVRHNIADGIYI